MVFGKSREFTNLFRKRYKVCHELSSSEQTHPCDFPEISAFEPSSSLEECKNNYNMVNQQFMLQFIFLSYSIGQIGKQPKILIFRIFCLTTVPDFQYQFQLNQLNKSLYFNIHNVNMKMNLKMSKQKTQQRKGTKKSQPYKSIKTTVQHINYTEQVNYPQFDFDYISKSIDLINQRKQQVKKQRAQSQKSKDSNSPQSFQLTSAQIVRKINMMRMECQEKQFIDRKKTKQKNPYAKKPKRQKESQHKQKPNKSYNSLIDKIVVPIDKISLSQSQSARYFNESSSQSRFNFVIRQKDKTIVQTELQQFISPEQIIKFQQQTFKNKRRRTSSISQQQPWQSYEDTMKLLARHLLREQAIEQQEFKSDSIQQQQKNSSVFEKYMKSEEYPFRDRRPQKKQYAIQTDPSPPLQNYKIEQLSSFSKRAKKQKQKIYKTEKLKTEQSSKWQKFAQIVKGVKDSSCNKSNFLIQLQNLVLENVNQLQSQISQHIEKNQSPIKNKVETNLFDPSNQKCNTFQNSSVNSQHHSEQFNSKKYIDYLQGQINDYEQFNSSEQIDHNFEQEYTSFTRNSKNYESIYHSSQTPKQNNQLSINLFNALHITKTSEANCQKRQSLYSEQFQNQEDRQLCIRTTNSGTFVIHSHNNFIQKLHKRPQIIIKQNQQVKNQKQQKQQKEQKEQRIKPYEDKEKRKEKEQFNQDYSQQSQDSKDQHMEIEKVQRGLLFEAFRQFTNLKDLIAKFKQNANEVKQKIEKLKILKKGFKTDQSQIKLFMQELIKNQMLNYQHILKNLQKSRGPTGLQILKYMHDDEDFQQSSNYQDDQEDLIIPKQVFYFFWSNKQNKIVQIFSILDKQGSVKLQRFKHICQIFYRSLFDCFNECLELQRNFGQFGQIFPWKSRPVFSHKLQIEQLNKKFENAKKKVLELSSTYCGIIVDKNQMKQLGNSQVYIDQVKKDRLIKMLKKDIIDEDSRWMFYDDEQVEVLVELSNMIALQLIEQGLAQINQAFQNAEIANNK